MPSVFADALPSVIGVEGGSAVSLDPMDKGNWTGGEIGKGDLRGTKFGISAASFPTVDIAALTLDQVRLIYLSNYWLPVYADLIEQAPALLLFDAAVNHGVAAAIRMLQAALGVPADGVIGPETKAAMQDADQDALAVELSARRSMHYVSASGFDNYGLGWMRRLASITYRAAQARPSTS